MPTTLPNNQNQKQPKAQGYGGCLFDSAAIVAIGVGIYHGGSYLMNSTSDSPTTIPSDAKAFAQRICDKHTPNTTATRITIDLENPRSSVVCAKQNPNGTTSPVSEVYVEEGATVVFKPNNQPQTTPSAPELP